jgi:hypothetical protein
MVELAQQQKKHSKPKSQEKLRLLYSAAER